MPSPLIEYVKKGLRNFYMEDQKCWSYIYHLDGRQNPSESLPAWDVFYSLNIILGFAALDKQDYEHDYNLPELLRHNTIRMLELPVPTYAYGMALWVSARLDVPLEEPIVAKIRQLVRDRTNWNSFRAQDAGMILTGMSEQKARGNNEYDPDVHDLYRFIRDNYLTSSQLFFDEPAGFRRNFASFATQTYLTTACYHYGHTYGSEEALGIADKASAKLISLQGPNGEWPWFYFAPKGIVVDNYEVYSVHQDGMAALFLNFAEKRGVPGALQASVKGFDWIFGQNQLKHDMLHPEVGMICRSIIRKGELNNKRKRMIRALVNGSLGRSDRYALPESLTLRLECRSYHLGWVLYSYGSRKDLRQITHHPEFEKALNQKKRAA